jgi:radical SAM protein with 4Fe4S-binding SPASM domain
MITESQSKTKEENKTLNHSERAQALAVIKSLPLVAKIEVTNRCNLRCIMCRNDHETRGFKDLDPALFDKLRPIFPGLLSAYLYGIGEVLTYPYLDPMIDELLSYGIRVGIITNGMLITDEMARGWVERGLYKISISVDGAHAESYERIRRGASFERLMKNVASIQKWKQHYRREYPIITLNYVAMRDTISELPALIDLASRFNAREVIVNDLIVFFDELKDQALRYSDQLLVDNFAQARLRAESSGIALYLPTAFRFQTEQTHQPKNKQKKINPCTEPWSGFWLTSDGIVTPCCYWMKPMGDLRTDDFCSIWNNDHYQQLRSTVNTDLRTPHCRRCAIAGMERR